jgi:hypothetical protein
MNAIERLENLLDAKDAENDELRAKLAKYERDDDEEMWSWTRHRRDDC